MAAVDRPREGILVQLRQAAPHCLVTGSMVLAAGVIFGWRAQSSNALLKASYVVGPVLITAGVAGVIFGREEQPAPPAAQIQERAEEAPVAVAVAPEVEADPPPRLPIAELQGEALLERLAEMAELHYQTASHRTRAVVPWHRHVDELQLETLPPLTLEALAPFEQQEQVWLLNRLPDERQRAAILDMLPLWTGSRQMPPIWNGNNSVHQILGLNPGRYPQLRWQEIPFENILERVTDFEALEILFCLPLKQRPAAYLQVAERMGSLMHPEWNNYDEGDWDAPVRLHPDRHIEMAIAACKSIDNTTRKGIGQLGSWLAEKGLPDRVREAIQTAIGSQP